MSQPTITLHYCEHGHVHMEIHRDDEKVFTLLLDAEGAMALSEELADCVEAIVGDLDEANVQEEKKEEPPTLN